MVQRRMRGSVMVVGAGVGGMRAAVDLADSGYKVYLLDSAPSIGGIVSQLGYMFPTHDCILCRGTSDHGYGCSRPSISPFLLDHSRHDNIEIMTNSTLVGATGEPGDFRVTVHHRPRHVDVSLCINCDECSKICPVDLTSEFQAGLASHKAAYKPSVRAAPNAYVIEKGPYCEPCRKCEEICPTKAIDLDAEDWFEEIDVGAIILTVGYRLYDPTPAGELGYGRYPNVVTGLEYERLASRSGPTEGTIERPSDSKVPERIAWLQCIGSRDQEHPYCSSICCMYATKGAVLAKQRLPDVACEVFIMDERAFSKEYTAYFEQSKDLWNVEYTRCRISEIKEDAATNDLIVYYQDEQGKLRRKTFDMVVLSVGSEPPPKALALAENLQIDLNEYGFCKTEKFEPVDSSRPGVFVAGAFATPKEISETVMDASGAAARCIALLSGQSGTETTKAEYPPERDVSHSEPRVGVFACYCHPTIDEVVDVDAVLAAASALSGVVHTEALEYGCLPGGTEAIRQAIRDHDLNRVVIGACTPRTHLALFQHTLQQEGLNPQLLEFVSLRDNCAWVHADNPAGATRKAKEEIRIAVARCKTLDAYQKERRDVNHAALVIGGGLAGMTSALAIADEGYDVCLIEKSDKLGGNLRRMYSTAEGPDPQQMLQSLAERVKGHERITLHVDTQVIGFEGQVGNFRSRLQAADNGHPARRWDVEHGVTIVATGGREYNGDTLPYGHAPRVVTQLELERQLIENVGAMQQLGQVVMIQCVNPPEQQVRYCSRVCCTSTMKNAITLKLMNPDCQVYVLHKDLMTYGFREKYYTRARELGVIFVRYEEGNEPEIEATPEGLQVRIHDEVLDQPIAFSPDLLALAMAVLPAETNQELAKILGVPLSTEGFFMEDNLKLRPMDFSREGIFLAGMAHYPKFIEETISQSLATAARAMTILSKDRLEVGGTIAIVDQAKCVGCLTCVRICPFQVPSIDPTAVGVGQIQGAAYIEPSLCTGCGICTSECPADAIQLRHYRDEQLVLANEPILGQWMPA
ncbi:MAG: 4Fe-4S binding protein [Anaerolineae bacterium]